jgi:hypothetical protein
MTTTANLNGSNGVNGYAAATKTRHTSSHPCPICGGSDDDRRGQGRRCFGYTMNGWCNCSREDHAGSAKFNDRSGTYSHKLRGTCPCGTEHSAADLLRTKTKKREGTIDRVYQYHDLDGTVLHETVRFRDPKGFRQRRPDGSGAYVWSIKGIKTILYRRPELLAADPALTVFVVEGEKDVDRLALYGQIATCNPMGAGKWIARYSEDLRGRHVVIIADKDQAGREHAQEVAGSLAGRATSVKIVELPGLPEKGDVSDFLNVGGTIEQVRDLVATTPEWKFDGERELPKIVVSSQE